MEKETNKQETPQKKSVYHAEGITYFDKKTERAFFFLLTLIMLIWGLLVKLNILG